MKIHKFLAVLLVLSMVLLPVSAATLGDMDNDGKKTTDDAVYLLLHVLFGSGNYPIAQGVDKDINADKKVDTDDAVYLLLHVLFGSESYPIGSDDRIDADMGLEDNIFGNN